MKPPKPKRLLLMMSGSIAAAKACELISAWRKAGHAVRVMVTESALQFVGRATLEGLSGEPVLSDTFAPGHAMAHIDWVRWADLIVLCPATANRLTALHHGRADDLVGTALLAVEPGTPVIAVPAMNTRMWQQPAVQAAVTALRQRGVTILPPASGALACGESGEGRLPEIGDILRFVRARLQPQRPGVLITAGGTCEAIDAVRVLSNRSSGRTGAALADAFSAAGWDVTLLRGQNAIAPRWPVRQQVFSDFADLQARLKNRLQTTGFDLVLHAAAVSDYSLARVNGEKAGQRRKISSDTETLTLSLKRNAKLVDRIKHWSRKPDTRLVAFKLTATNDTRQQRAAVDKLLQRSQADWVVHNDQLEIDANRHGFRLYAAPSSRSGAVAVCPDAFALADAIQAQWAALGNPAAGTRPLPAANSLIHGSHS